MAKSKTELLSQSTWKFDKAMSGGADVTAFIDACYKDNTATFVANGTGTSDEGASKCNSGDPQSTSFNWAFSNNETVLQVDAAIFGGNSGSFDIINLTSTQLVLQGDFNTSGGTITAQFYFKH